MSSARRRLVLWLGLGVAVAAALYVVARVVDWPDWAEPIARYILEVGLPATLRVSAVAVVGSACSGSRSGRR